MTAYSFKARFVAPIQAGTKRQTIRARGRRAHARPGGLVQLYTGMRTRACRKIVPDVVCESVVPVVFDLRRVGIMSCGAPLGSEVARLHFDGAPLTGAGLVDFARADGFDNFDDMVRFWLTEHGPTLFEGVCICWREITP